MKRPESVTEEQLVFLDNLRESGVTNMFGAMPHIGNEFPHLKRQEVKDLLLYWMESFGERNPN